MDRVMDRVVMVIGVVNGFAMEVGVGVVLRMFVYIWLWGVIVGLS